VQEERIKSRRDAFLKQMQDKEKNAEARKKVRHCFHCAHSVGAREQGAGMRHMSA